MNSKILLLLFTLIFSRTPAVMGQYIFENFEETDGLSSRQTNCVYKDADGFLWVGAANGLNRFDGNTFRKFGIRKGERDLFVNAIYPIDSNESLLVGTSVGIRVFNKAEGMFVKDLRFSALTHQPILAIKKDDKGRLWIIGPRNITIFTDNRLTPAENVVSAAKGLSDHDFTYAAFSAFCWDSSREGFWIGGPKTFFLDCKNNALYDQNHNPGKYQLLDYTNVTAIALDRRFDIWFSSNKDLSTYHLTEYQVDKYKNIDANLIFIDKMERVWISTWSYSAYMKMPGDTMMRIPFNQDDLNSIAYGHFRDAAQDSEGNIWLATINGISKNSVYSPIEAIYKLPSFEFHLRTGFAAINKITIQNNQVVASKDDGIVFYDLRSRASRNYTVASKGNLLRNKFTSSTLNAGTWWFAGVDGINFMRPGDRKLSRFSQVNKGEKEVATFIFTDVNGQIWFQILNDALYRYDPRTTRLQRFGGRENRFGTFQYQYCQSYLQLKNGNLIFPMENTGFLHFDQKTEKFTVTAVANPESFFCPDLIEDSKGYIWSSLWGRGLVKTDKSGRVIDSLNSANSIIPDRVSSICIDSKGHLWAAGPDGLFFVNLVTKRGTRVEIDLGKNLEDYWNDLLIHNDLLYAVMLDHVVVINPLQFERNSVSRPPNIVSVKALGKEVTGFRKSGTLELPMEENSVSLEFVSVNHRDVPSLQYSYALDGIDDDWISAGRNMVANYNNLSPGSYSFRVRSTDGQGRWMKQMTTLKIKILPLWWQTWWFFILVGSLSSAFLYLTYDSYLGKKQKIALDRTIEYIANSPNSETSVSEICWDVARSCISQLHFKNCSVYLWDGFRDKLVQRVSYGAHNLFETDLSDPMELELGQGIVGMAAKIKKTLIISDTSRNPEYIVFDKSGISEIAVPIMHETKIIGVLESEHNKKNFFNAEHARALMTIASISANKIAEAQAEDEAAAKEIMLLETNKMLAESQLMALRAQMNPHFVFNCLNSIQECIVTQKYGEGSKYLNKFSKLFRMVLHNSDKNLVTIEEEKEVLKLYLELEQMRFEQSFRYRMEIDDELEADEILLPSMLLQPYVENALWHGLMHKPDDRELSIEFIRINDEVFRCIIDDNGIGRKLSYEIKQKSARAKLHKSKGLQIAKDRIDLLERQGKHALVDIIDKYDTFGNATGTRVIIELSTSLNHT
jgi:ligand-binding sensor domain-containing protein/putative methionine-R-sulfoxide reductase with GAF domain